MTTGRRRKTPGQLAAARVGDWPVEVSRSRSVGAAHARGVWEAARSGMVNRGQGLMAHVGGDRVSFEGQVDLAFLATVGAHIRRCDLCWREWADGEVPGELLTAAVRRRKAGEVFGVLVKEIRAQRAAGRAGGGSR